jgi:HlyD family secretion protein
VYQGRVSFISPEAEFTPKNVQTDKERVKLVYRVKIDISNSQMELKPGMPADVEIRLNEAPTTGEAKASAAVATVKR